MSTATHELSETLLFAQRLGNQFGDRFSELIKQRAAGGPVTDELIQQCYKEVCEAHPGPASDPDYDVETMRQSLVDYANNRCRNAREILSGLRSRSI